MCKVPDNFITSDMVNHLRCDRPEPERIPTTKIQKCWLRPRFMFVFENGDLNLAAYILAETMHEPFDPFTIASVAVQSSVRDEFIARLRSRFHQVKPHVALHPNFERTLQELETGNVKYVVADEEDAPPFASPIVVTDNVTHLYFSTSPSGVVTLKTFDTIDQAALFYSREQPRFDVIHVFDESIASVYSLAKCMNGVQFYVNCVDACLLPILSFYGMQQARALVQNGYHYETLQIGTLWRIIVFPVSTSFLSLCCCPTGECHCVGNRHTCCD